MTPHFTVTHSTGGATWLLIGQKSRLETQNAVGAP